MTECSCFICKGACRHSPGWFAPGEVEKAAELKGMSLRRFFKRFLGVAWGWEGTSTENIFVLSPAVVGTKAGEEFPHPEHHGQCVFYKNGLCDIHAARPAECRAYIHTQTIREAMNNRTEVLHAWKDNQDQIKELLGREQPRATVVKLKDGGWM